MEITNSRGSVWKKWDLHLHSTASDGKCTPMELIDAAVKNNISVIALTDHHTVNNLNEIKRLGKEKGINVISGIEFRTEYGQKSVHMIGLFPDYYNKILLDEAALNDLILSPLGLSKTKIISVGYEIGREFINDEAAYKAGLLHVQVDFKKAADLIHKYGGLVSVHAGSKANSFEEEMKHEGKSPKNVSELADSLGTVKEELLKSYIDICEVRKSKEASFYQEKFNKPAIAASDAHNIDEFARNYVWIKGETTFEGLRQILFEPKSRVKIQISEPEQKSDYLVIDSLKINHKDFGEQTIVFNQGLNTIIGGRSSGKSVLLGCIARLCGDTTKIKKNRPEFDDYINNIVKDMSIEWRDHTEMGNRKIDFFPQSYIIDVASDKKKISELVVRILRADNGFNDKMTELQNFLLAGTGKIRTLFSQYKTIKQEKDVLYAELLSLGNKNGIKQEIEKVKLTMDKLKTIMEDNLTEKEEEEFEEQKAKVVFYEKQKEGAQYQIKILKNIQSLQLMVDITDKMLDLNMPLYEFVEKSYSDLKVKVESTWKESIQTFIVQQEKIISDSKVQIENIETSKEFRKAVELYAKNQEYMTYSDKLKEETKRLEGIYRKEKDIAERDKKLIELKESMIKEHASFYIKYQEFCNTVCLEKENVKIYPYISFKQHEYTELINRFFDGRSAINQKVICYQNNLEKDYTFFISDVFDKLLKEEFVLRRGVECEEVAEALITLNGFRIDYNIQYQGDNLESMSEGKMAFVILRLLLDFSKSDYPILIDQPEDDLDNRAIYTELVKYLRTKKEYRQIILVTHNPNIVVGGDAEEIIVANQHGINSPNPQAIKFVYRTGALEESFKNNNSEILLCQGIREHVCDILEGGNMAFQERENKYQL